MAIIYRLRYSDNGEFKEQSFLYEQDARFNFDRLLGEPKVTTIDLYRQRIMRPSVKTILRILNGESYVYEQKHLATHDEQQAAKEAARDECRS